MIACCFASMAITGNKVSAQAIRLNQLGFYTHAPKIAVVTGDTLSNTFCLIKEGTRDTVYTGTLQAPVHSPYITAATRLANFTAFSTPGKYVLWVKGCGSSYPFAIGNNAQHRVAVAALKGYYYQRVSMPLDARYAGIWARPAGHADTAVIIHLSAASPQRPAGTIIACAGGWYDAGDYNKYIVNCGITMGTLLSAYEDFSQYFDTLKTNIPESRGKTPYILNEIIYNLR